jgi:hypothetical protein
MPPHLKNEKLPAETKTSSLYFDESILFILIFALALTGGLSLWSAQLGVHNGVAVAVLSIGISSFLAKISWRYLVPATYKLKSLVAALLVFFLSLALFLPGSFYTYGDKDPGVYVLHGLSIAKTGDVLIDDVFAAQGDGLLEMTYPGMGFRFPGFWFEEAGDASQILPQFFHFLPATFATAFDLGGLKALLHFNSLIAALSVTVGFLALRRVFSPTVAWVGAALLATNMIQVWQAKYPTTEMLAQLFLLSASLSAIVAFDLRQKFFAGLAGFFTSIIFLVRPDGFLLLIPAAFLAAWLYGVIRLKTFARWLAVGLLIPLPLVFYQAHFRNSRYATTVEVPSLQLFFALFVVLTLCAFGLYRRPNIGDSLIAKTHFFWRDDAPTTLMKNALYFLVIATGIFFAVRFMLLGEHYSYFGRTFDERNLYRLSLFVSLPVLIFACFGLFLLIASWQWQRWLLFAPGLLTLPVYLYQARVSPRLMWWVRRYAPTALPVILFLAAVGLSWFLCHKDRFQKLSQVAGVLAVAAILAMQLSQSLPLREHREMDGAYSLGSDIQKITPGQEPALLWDPVKKGDIFDSSRNLSSVLWLAFDRPGHVFSKEVTLDLLSDFGSAYHDRTVYFVSKSEDLPEGSSEALTYIGTVEGTIDYWEESIHNRPQKAKHRSEELFIWWLNETAPPS